jgi:hypothetical protein
MNLTHESDLNHTSEQHEYYHYMQPKHTGRGYDIELTQIPLLYSTFYPSVSL